MTIQFEHIPGEVEPIILLLRREADRVRQLTKVIIALVKMVIQDFNRDRMEFEGLTVALFADFPALAVQQQTDFSVAPANAGLRDLPNAQPGRGLRLPTAPIWVGRNRLLRSPASSTLAHPVHAVQVARQRVAPRELQSFF